jgi:hypothetical protein
MTIVIGPHRRPDSIRYTVKKRLVCAASGVFKRLLEEQSASLSGIVTNELCLNDDCLLVRAFVNLLYGDRPAILDRPRGDGGGPRIRGNFDFVELYKFAEKYEIDSLRDIAIDALQDELKIEGVPSFARAKRVFVQTAEGPKNKIRRFFTAMSTYSYLTEMEDGSEILLENQPDFLKDWLAFQRTEHQKRPTLRIFGVDPRNQVSSNEDITGFPLCYFHVHPPDQECPSKPNHGPMAFQF